MAVRFFQLSFALSQLSISIVDLFAASNTRYFARLRLIIGNSLFYSLQLLGPQFYQQVQSFLGIPVNDNKRVGPLQFDEISKSYLDNIY